MGKDGEGWEQMFLGVKEKDCMEQVGFYKCGAAEGTWTQEATISLFSKSVSLFLFCM